MVKESKINQSLGDGLVVWLVNVILPSQIIFFKYARYYHETYQIKIPTAVFFFIASLK